MYGSTHETEWPISASGLSLGPSPLVSSSSQCIVNRSSRCRSLNDRLPEPPPTTYMQWSSSTVQCDSRLPGVSPSKAIERHGIGSPLKTIKSSSSGLDTSRVRPPKT
eukprot:3102299-Prymnesium_polylepis.1